ncbi:PREDICTED: uncharacterized protein LOC109586015 [Amphimedon queenslandica]|uniref:Uncharacterized protein n=1 Tax=Amphimedon queenslandica TaxID=400682 RepID=A0A1X7VQN3_AMPQE|nr:PREDICTED: uncharacterized protein LOC109586015 [Amphimedon queenslandica]|eukprot:XP_019857741.1 PREDICTED: uncharacterized protein LOC109586015 [Amphimedon queenslandica]
MKIKWRGFILAGILGSASGKLYSHLKEHPLPLDKEKWQPVAKGVACAAFLGSGVGLAIGWYRNKPLYIYPLSVGANFAFATASFLGIRFGLLKLVDDIRDAGEQQNDIVNERTLGYAVNAASGCTVGIILAAVSRRSIASVLLHGFGGILAGVGSQLTYDQFELWRKRKAIEINYPELSKDQKWTFEKFEIAWLEFWHRDLKADNLKADISLLEEHLKQERERIEFLDQELSKLGLDEKDLNKLQTHSPQSPDYDNHNDHHSNDDNNSRDIIT